MVVLQEASSYSFEKLRILEISTPELNSIDSFIYLSSREALNLYTHPRQSKSLKSEICLSQILSYNTPC